MKLFTLLERMDYTLLQSPVKQSSLQPDSAGQHSANAASDNPEPLETDITALVYDSRKAVPGCLFVCISGTLRDAHDFIPQVLEAGATALVVEREVSVPEGITVILVKNARLALACLSAAWFGHPAEKLKTIGITGTKGKTTTTYMVKSILERSGFRPGLIGTIETIIGEETIPSANTTPESYLVQEYFSRMVEAGCDSVVMEVSSQGLMLHRVSGFTFDYGIFTNLEPDHIGENEHKDFDDYMHCKGLLFQQCKVGIVNLDNEHVADVLAGHTCQLETFGYARPSAATGLPTDPVLSATTSETAEAPDHSLPSQPDLRADNIRLVTKPGILGVSYHVSGLLDFDVEVDVPGSFSVYNSLTAVAICRHFGVPIPAIQAALKEVRVKGRIEILPVAPHFTVMIDYAHNAMSLESLLTTLREYQPKRLVCLFGCGGNRDKARRYEMGEVSSRLADLSVVTSDNPRNEEPMAIIEDILTGIHRADGAYVTIPDRKEAIRYCFDHAREGDVIVLAGKGHEDYQEIRGVKYHMDERELVADVLKEGNYPWKK